MNSWISSLYFNIPAWASSQLEKFYHWTIHILGGSKKILVSSNSSFVKIDHRSDHRPPVVQSTIYTFPKSHLGDPKLHSLVSEFQMLKSKFYSGRAAPITVAHLAGKQWVTSILAEHPLNFLLQIEQKMSDTGRRSRITFQRCSSIHKIDKIVWKRFKCELYKDFSRISIFCSSLLTSKAEHVQNNFFYL